MVATLPGIEDERPDTELVAAAQGGDRRALDLLLRRYAGTVHAVCRRLTGNAEDADDAMQEALIAVARGISRFDGRSRFSTWVYRVATNAALDELRRRRRRPEPVESNDGAEPARERAVDAAVVDRLDVDAALARLAPDFRAAVVLRDLLGLDYAEIADVLGIPVGTVRSRISRGRAGLVPLLTDPSGRAGNASPASDRPTRRP